MPGHRKSLLFLTYNNTDVSLDPTTFNTFSSSDQVVLDPPQPAYSFPLNTSLVNPLSGQLTLRRLVLREEIPHQT